MSGLSHHLRREWFVLALILVVAAGFRFWALDSAPPGLYPDEAMNGNNALEVLHSGNPDVFYPQNNGREGLYANLQAISISLFGNTPFALRVVSALMGLLTVLGTYLLTRRLFDNWGIAALAAFLMAIGFWHVNFSRIGFRAIMAPMFGVWSFYYLAQALRTGRHWHWLLAGALLGLGMHTYIAFRIMPVVALLVLLVYWQAVRRDFSGHKYTETRNRLARGLVWALVAFALVVLPLAWYFFNHPGSFTGRTTQVSVFSSATPVTDVSINTVRTLGMFVTSGDLNWRHNLAGEPILVWPVAALFVVGLMRSFLKVGRTLRTHGHISTVHALLLGWFVFGLVPAVVSNEGIPHALRAILVAPPVYIFAAEGLWWLYTYIRRSYHVRDARMLCMPDYLAPGSHGHEQCTSRSRLVAVGTLSVFLFALTVQSASSYFRVWARHQQTRASFNEEYVELAERISHARVASPVYVIVEARGVLVDGIPMPAQTVMFLTDSWTPLQQERTGIHYLTPEQARTTRIPSDAAVFTLR